MLSVPSPTTICAVQLSCTVVFEDIIVEISWRILSVLEKVVLRVLFSVELVNHLTYVVKVSVSLSVEFIHRVRFCVDRLEFPADVLNTTCDIAGGVLFMSIERLRIEEFKVLSPTIIDAVQFSPFVVFGL